MDVTQSQQGPITVLSINGPIIGGELGSLDTHVDECIKAGLLKIILDIGQVPFIDSEGIDKILAITFDMGKQGGDARVATPNDVCRDIFAATGVDGMIQIFEARDAAVKSLL